MELNRRSFLKGIAVLGAGLFVDKFDILLPNETIYDDFNVFGKFRALSQYDIYHDKFFIRYDILTKKNVGLSVDGYIEADMLKHDFIKRVHRPMVSAMKNRLMHDKIRKQDLVTIAYPHGYTHPNWVRTMFA